jgi:hypothetical protein
VQHRVVLEQRDVVVQADELPLTEPAVVGEAVEDPHDQRDRVEDEEQHQGRQRHQIERAFAQSHPTISRLECLQASACLDCVVSLVEIGEESFDVLVDQKCL